MIAVNLYVSKICSKYKKQAFVMAWNLECLTSSYYTTNYHLRITPSTPYRNGLLGQKFSQSETEENKLDIKVF